MQKALNERIGVNLEGLSAEEKTRWILNYTRAMTQEIAELNDSVPWKWWAKYQKFDEQNARVEVVDLFHFLISLAQVLGMSADDVFNAYVKKNAVNFKRQESGYTRERRTRFETHLRPARRPERKQPAPAAPGSTAGRAMAGFPETPGSIAVTGNGMKEPNECDREN